MRQVAVLGCVLLLACGDRKADGSDTQESEGVNIGSTGTGTIADMGPTGCQPDDCADDCEERDDCHVLYVGVCEGDVCVCIPPDSNCLPCGSAGPCLEWEGCFEEYTVDGECQIPCSYQFEFAWDAAVDCAIQLHPELPTGVLVLGFYVRIDGMSIPRDNDCIEPNSYGVDTEQRLLTLCPTACAQFEAAGVLQTGWSVVCE